MMLKTIYTMFINTEVVTRYNSSISIFMSINIIH